MKCLNVMLFCTFCAVEAFPQINVALLHQLVDNSRSEHARQSSLRDKHATITGAEALNAKQTAEMKNTYRLLRARFSSLGMGIEALKIGTEALPLLQQIYADQSAVVYLCRDDPKLILLALDTQTDLVERSRMLVRYLYGLATSIGDIDAMARSDRAVLSGFVVSEIRALSLVLSGLKSVLISLSAVREKRSTSLFSDMFEQDRRIAEQILGRIRQLSLK